jgi:hypothetical protein
VAVVKQQMAGLMQMPKALCCLLDTPRWTSVGTFLLVRRHERSAGKAATSSVSVVETKMGGDADDWSQPSLGGYHRRRRDHLFRHRQVWESESCWEFRQIEPLRFLHRLVS